MKNSGHGFAPNPSLNALDIKPLDDPRSGRTARDGLCQAPCVLAEVASGVWVLLGGFAQRSWWFVVCLLLSRRHPKISFFGFPDFRSRASGFRRSREADVKNRIRPLEPLKIFELLPAWPCSWKFLDSCDRPGPSASNLHAISKEPRGRTNPPACKKRIAEGTECIRGLE